LRLGAGLGEAEAAAAEASKALADAGDEAAVAQAAADKQALLTQAREKADQARLKLGTFETAARMRTARLGQIETETSNWQRRRDGAAGQLATLEARQAEIAAQLEAASATPDSFAQRRAAIDAD